MHSCFLRNSPALPKVYGYTCAFSLSNSTIVITHPCRFGNYIVIIAALSHVSIFGIVIIIDFAHSSGISLLSTMV